MHQVLARCVQRGGDRADRHAEHVGDGRVVVVEVVAKEESIALPDRKPAQRRADILDRCLHRRRGASIGALVRPLGANGLACVDGGVEDAAADPCLDWSRAAETVVSANRAGEPFLDSITRELWIRCSGKRESKKSPPRSRYTASIA
jgi:hypothetical protein